MVQVSQKVSKDSGKDSMTDKKHSTEIWPDLPNATNKSVNTFQISVMYLTLYIQRYTARTVNSQK